MWICGWKVWFPTFAQLQLYIICQFSWHFNKQPLNAFALSNGVLIISANWARRYVDIGTICHKIFFSDVLLNSNHLYIESWYHEVYYTCTSTQSLHSNELYQIKLRFETFLWDIINIYLQRNQFIRQLKMSI